MLKVIITQGLPASGKTTWAKGLIDKEPGRWKRINKDDLRALLDNSHWSRNNEQFILEVRDTLIKAALYSGFSVIVDDTNLAPKHELKIRELVKQHNAIRMGGARLHPAQVEIKDFTDITPEVCIERDLKRPNSVGSKVILDMYKQFLALKPKICEYDNKLRDCIICDIDGTLALFGDKNPYDRDFENDNLNIPIADIVKQYLDKVQIFFVSGRSDNHIDVTMKWLQDKFYGSAEKARQSKIGYQLLMRKTGDVRKDSVIKKEIYESYIKGLYNVLFVLDDRNQMVEMWRNLGLTCLQVAEGDF